MGDDGGGGVELIDELPQLRIRLEAALEGGGFLAFQQPEDVERCLFFQFLVHGRNPPEAIPQREQAAPDARLYRSEGRSQLFRNLRLRQSAEEGEIDRFPLRIGELSEGGPHPFPLIVAREDIIGAPDRRAVAATSLGSFATASVRRDCRRRERRRSIALCREIITAQVNKLLRFAS